MSEKCSACDKYVSFEAVQLSVKGYMIGLVAIKCVACGAVHAFMPQTDPGKIGEANQKAINELATRVTQLEEAVTRLIQLLGAR